MIIQKTDPNLKTYFLATRPMFLSASVLAVILGTAVGYHLSGNFDSLAFLLALLSVIFVHASINVINDVYDDLGGTDRVNTKQISPFTGGSRFIQNDILSNQQMLRLGIILMLVAILPGLGLILYKGYVVLLFGLMGVVLGVTYSVPPFTLAARGIGEAAVGFGFGVLPVTGAAWLQTGELSANALLFSIPISAWVANILLINEVPDSEADGSTGKRTLVVRYGDNITAILYLIANLIASGTLLSISIVNDSVIGTIVPLLLFVLALFACYTITQWSKKPRSLVNGIKATLTIHILGSLWMTIWVLTF